MFLPPTAIFNSWEAILPNMIRIAFPSILSARIYLSLAPPIDPVSFFAINTAGLCVRSVRPNLIYSMMLIIGSGIRKVGALEVCDGSDLGVLRANSNVL